MVKFIIKVLSFFNKFIVKKENKICFISFPDFSDNAISVFNYIIKEKLVKYEIVWLVKDTHIPKEINDLKKIFKIKVIKKNSLLGFINYMTSKYVFYTHGAFNGVECLRKQVIINLWHGMPIKKIGLLDNKTEDQVPTFTYSIATSSIFQDILSKSFGVSKDKILVSGSPRNDEMSINRNLLKGLITNLDKFNKRILWMPTYRASVIGDIRVDGIYKNSTLPLLSNDELIELNNYLKELNNICIIKLHPMDKLNASDFSNFSNIKFLNNEDLQSKNIMLNSIFVEVDALITDYSSVYFDFILLDKPIGFILNDIEEYKENRGFVFDNIYDWLPGNIIKELPDFKLFVNNLNKGIDDSSVKRQYVNNKVNKYKDFNSTKRLLTFLGIK